MAAQLADEMITEPQVGDVVFSKEYVQTVLANFDHRPRQAADKFLALVDKHCKTVSRAEVERSLTAWGIPFSRRR